MKKLITAYLFLFSSLMLTAQNFEGIVTYKSSYKSKNSQITEQQLEMMLGSRLQYLIKGGNFKIKSNGSLLQWQLYRENDTKVYTKLSNANKPTVKNATISTDTIVSQKLNKNAYNYLGTPCDELIITCKNSIQKFYFNSSFLKVSSESFKNYNYKNWYAYFKQSNALPLRVVVDNTDFSVEFIAGKVDTKVIPISEFILR